MNPPNTPNAPQPRADQPTPSEGRPEETKAAPYNASTLWNTESLRQPAPAETATPELPPTQPDLLYAFAKRVVEERDQARRERDDLELKLSAHHAQFRRKDKSLLCDPQKAGQEISSLRHTLAATEALLGERTKTLESLRQSIASTAPGEPAFMHVRSFAKWVSDCDTALSLTPDRALQQKEKLK